MSTPHIAAEKGQIAERILLPGDPLRAKYIAENFLDGAKEYTHVRNILGYTGTYKGVPVSVQGTGMGIPTISIYVPEHQHEDGCKKHVRVYTLAAGAQVQALALFTFSDHLLTGEACTADERQTSFNDMIKIALETAIED